MKLIIEFLKQKKQEIIDLNYSNSNIEKMTDICLDVRSSVDKLEKDKTLIKFIDFDLRLSINPFAFLLEKDEQSIDENDTIIFWEDAKKELIYDLSNIISNLEKKK